LRIDLNSDHFGLCEFPQFAADNANRFALLNRLNISPKGPLSAPVTEAAPQVIDRAFDSLRLSSHLRFFTFAHLAITALRAASLRCFGVSLAHRARAASLAASDRCCGVILAALRLPPRRPASCVSVVRIVSCHTDDFIARPDRRWFAAAFFASSGSSSSYRPGETVESWLGALTTSPI
jgi:hypothetical protein